VSYKIDGISALKLAEVAIVGALGAGSGTPLDLLDQSRVVGIIALVKEVEGSAHALITLVTAVKAMRRDLIPTMMYVEGFVL
jgi:hypothetical protein